MPWDLSPPGREPTLPGRAGRPPPQSQLLPLARAPLPGAGLPPSPPLPHFWSPRGGRGSGEGLEPARSAPRRALPCLANRRRQRPRSGFGGGGGVRIRASEAERLVARRATLTPNLGTCPGGEWGEPGGCGGHRRGGERRDRTESRQQTRPRARVPRTAGGRGRSPLRGSGARAAEREAGRACRARRWWTDRAARTGKWPRPPPSRLLLLRRKVGGKGLQQLPAPDPAPQLTLPPLPSTPISPLPTRLIGGFCRRVSHPCPPSTPSRLLCSPDPEGCGKLSHLFARRLIAEGGSV